MLEILTKRLRATLLLPAACCLLMLMLLPAAAKFIAAAAARDSCLELLGVLLLEIPGKFHETSAREKGEQTRLEGMRGMNT